MSCPYSPEPIPRCLQGRTAALLVSGPSLTPRQVWEASQAGFALMGCNNQCVYALDVMWAPDLAWLQTANPRTDHIPQCWSTLTTAQRSPRAPVASYMRPGWHYVETVPDLPFSADPWKLARGRHAGYQLINMAALMGVKRAVLLGYDCREIDGERHWFGHHPAGPLRRSQEFEVWIGLYRELAGPVRDFGMEVLNATPGTAVDAFPCVELSKLL